MNRIYTTDALDALVTPEGSLIEVDSLAGYFNNLLLTAVYTDGRFDAVDPATDEEHSFHISTSKVYAVD